MTRHKRRHTKGDILLEKYAIRKPFTRTKRESPNSVARRGGKSSAEARLEAREKQRQDKVDSRRKQERKEKEARAQRKLNLSNAKEELEGRLKFRAGLGNRVRAALRDRKLSLQVVKENNENEKRIVELKRQIKRLE